MVALQVCVVLCCLTPAALDQPTVNFTVLEFTARLLKVPTHLRSLSLNTRGLGLPGWGLGVMDPEGGSYVTEDVLF
jgi:hypothetical protein